MGRGRSLDDSQKERRMSVLNPTMAPRVQPHTGLNGNGNGHSIPGGPHETERLAHSTRTPTPEEIVDSLRFMFAVGIECSNPLVANHHRVDQLELTGHYDNWKKDLHLVKALGLRYLRYGPPIHRILTGPGQYDWKWLDGVMAEMQHLGIR